MVEYVLGGSCVVPDGCGTTVGDVLGITAGAGAGVGDGPKAPDISVLATVVARFVTNWPNPLSKKLPMEAKSKYWPTAWTALQREQFMVLNLQGFEEVASSGFQNPSPWPPRCLSKNIGSMVPNPDCIG